MNTQNPRRNFLNKRMGLFKRAALWSYLFGVVATALWAMPQAASNEPQNMLGTWQGFFSHPPDPTIPVSSEITSQDMRRINGMMGILPCTLTLNGTVAANGNVNIKGQDEHHQAIAKLDLHDFGGGAAVLNGSLALLAVDGQVTDGTLLLLRPFAVPPSGEMVPNPAGLYRGTYRNTDGASGDLVSFLTSSDSQQPTRLTGQVVVVVAGTRHVLEMVGTINVAGKLIAIAQGPAGHIILDATWADPPDDGMPAMITGRHTLELNDGSVYEGTFSITAG